MIKARTNLLSSLILVISLSVASSAQNAPTSQTAPLPVNIQDTLAKVEQAAQAAALDLARLRIEKWKADGNEKQQAQSNADSLQRNMTAALPTLTAAVRNSPQDFGANFKLYRNLNALYDVFKTLTESAGAFGPKQEFEALAPYAEAFDQDRRSLGDYMENLAVAKEAELNRLRAQSRGGQSNVAPAPRKVIIDDDQPAPKKKSAKKKPASTSATPPK